MNVEADAQPLGESHPSRWLHLLGVRHHGPGSARAVVQTLETVRPSVVLVELPADLQSALPWVGADGLVPPVALLGYVVAEPARAVFAPFGAFSPEWQAIRWANDNDVEVRAIDLPLAVTLGSGSGSTAGDDDQPPDDLFGEQPPPDPLRDLAAAAGDPDPERWWEDVIEHRGDGPAAFDAVADAMAAVRAGFVPSRRELQREAHMRRAIRCGPPRVRRAGRRRVWGVARSCDRRHRRPVSVRERRRGGAARPAQAEGGIGLGAVDPSPPGGHVRLRSRASRARAGTATCSNIPARTASPASSSRSPACCARSASVRRPTTSSPAPAWRRRWQRCAVGLAPGSPRCSMRPTR